MRIVIDIPEETYNFLKRYGGDGGIIDKAVLNGNPLPKGHGRLIDADELNKCIVDRITMPYVPINKIQDVPTIIDADKEND